MSRRSAGKILFVILYSARTGDYKLTTRQEQETFLPHHAFKLEPSFVRYLSCCRLPIYCSPVVCKFVIRFLCSLLLYFLSAFVLSSFLASPFYRLFCCLKAKNHLPFAVARYRPSPLHFDFLFAIIFSAKNMSRTDPSDFDYPPGLSISRNRPHEQEQSIGIPATNLGSINQQDRRQSNGLTSYSSINCTSRSWVPPEQRDHSCELSGPNRHNPSASLGYILSPSLLNTFNNHNHRPLPSPHHPANSHHASGVIYPSSSPNDRDGIYLRQAQSPNQLHFFQNSLASRSTIWWGDLEPWMDEEYAKQVCSLMGWDPVSIKVPHPAPDASTGQQANNPGYCFLTFPSPAHAASVLTQISSNVNGAPVPMPNSAKPFVMNWASSVGPTSPMYSPFSATNGAQATGVQQYPKEYSIFVGDLAPETSNSDLVAVFRNPVLGLRNDREPKFIRPFLSCKSAKIMLDPLTGVSRGYGFVRSVPSIFMTYMRLILINSRFTDEADQQRALIEMHGLYCLSRPSKCCALNITHIFN